MAGLIEATTLSAAGSGYTVDLDSGWDIWGPAGGYIAAIALRAVREPVAEGHRSVTLTGQFVRVAKAGRLDVQVEAIKQGNTALFVVTLAQGGQPVFPRAGMDNGPKRCLTPCEANDARRPFARYFAGQDEIVAERGIQQLAF